MHWSSDVRERVAVLAERASSARLLLGLLPFVAVIPLLIWRLIDEEKVLTKELEGYGQYRQRVRYRLVPRVW
jgi:protein-S-isoprenylcysteine O-methyltransferase Ste14